MLANRGSSRFSTCGAMSCSSSRWIMPRRGINAVAVSVGSNTRAWHRTNGAGWNAPYAGDSRVLLTSVAVFQTVSSGTSRLNPGSPETVPVFAWDSNTWDSNSRDLGTDTSTRPEPTG